MTKECVIKTLENALKSDKMKIYHRISITEEGLERIIEILKEPEKMKGMWIPVSEKLPENEDRYLCTVEIRSGNTSGLYIEICTYYKNLYTSEGFFKWEKGLKREENVIAWMPLPEPYMNGKEK